jgi:DNA-directed RNA polymerase subunit alpha
VSINLLLTDRPDFAAALGAPQEGPAGNLEAIPLFETQVQPKIEMTASADNYAAFTIEPLDAGFGTTLGNALRRVLLSSLPGTAVTSVRIDGVQHEFSSIPNVKEDVTEFLLAVKQLRLRAFSDRPGKMYLESEGEGRVTAGDVQAAADFEIVNPELHMATLDSKNAHFSVEFNVERGKGYVPAGQRDSLPIGVIPVDAIFTPVRKVNYSVEPMRIGSETNYDRLVLQIWTDGTITPVEALSQSAVVLQDHLGLFADLGKLGSRGAAAAATGAPAIPAKVYETPIEELDLSVRAYNCLKRSGITKVGQILEMSEEDLLAVRNFGRKSLDELRERLLARGFISELPPPSAAYDEAEDEDLVDEDEEDESIDFGDDEFDEDEE